MSRDKRILLGGILGGLAGMALAYLATAFVEADWALVHWSRDDRIATLPGFFILGAIFAFFGVLLADEA